MSKDTILAFCTCPDQDTAARIANALVERRIAACVNLLPGITSVYQWQGKCESSREVQMLIKTRAERFSDLEQAILSLHPYELPELITVAVGDGLPDYLNWIDKCTTKPS